MSGSEGRGNDSDGRIRQQPPGVALSTDRTARGRLALNPQTQEPSQPVLASVEASTLTISVLVWHSHEFVDRGVYLESAPNLHRDKHSSAGIRG